MTIFLARQMILIKLFFIDVEEPSLLITENKSFINEHFFILFAIPATNTYVFRKYFQPLTFN